MPLDTSQVGATSKAYRHVYGWQQQAVYALGIGAERDELDYLYENTPGGMKVYPTYAVVPAFEPVFELLATAQAELPKIVHGAQTIRAHRPVPAEGEIETVGTIVGIYDMKRWAIAVVETKSTLNGEPLFDTEWSILIMGEGGFKGERPPKDLDSVRVPRDRDPDWTVEQTTSPEQALLYRVSGDTNPLHADREFAAKAGFDRGPILHGLCTYGHIARAAIQKVAGGDGAQLRAMSAQFRKPVWPGDTIVTRGWDLGGGKVALQATVKERPDPVVKNAWAQF